MLRSLIMELHPLSASGYAAEPFCGTRSRLIPLRKTLQHSVVIMQAIAVQVYSTATANAVVAGGGSQFCE